MDRLVVHCVAVCLCAAAGAPAVAQPWDVDPGNKYSWSETGGFMNWRDAGAGTQGVRAWNSYLSGFIWSERFGWITVGDGTPANGVSYANSDGTDFGVNRNGVGDLSGYAWGERIGWINFSGGALASPPNPAGIDPFNRLVGFAWSPAAGWINLDDATVFVQLLCPADYNDDGFVDGIDYDQFNNDFESGAPEADFNGDGFVDGIDYDVFNNHFETGC